MIQTILQSNEIPREENEVKSLRFIHELLMEILGLPEDYVPDTASDYSIMG